MKLLCKVILVTPRMQCERGLHRQQELVDGIAEIDLYEYKFFRKRVNNSLLYTL